MYAILAALAALAFYLGMLAVEARRGARFFEGKRARLDSLAAQGALIVAHVDFASFAREQTVLLARRAGHDVARSALGIVRAAERFLTRIVRWLHMHTDVPRPSGEGATRAFVRTLSEFKGQLEATRPELPDVR